MKNLKMMVKLVGAFVVVALITLIVGGVGWMGVNTLSGNINEIGKVRLPSIASLQIIEKEAESIRVAQRTLLDPGLSKEDRHRQKENIAAARKRYKIAWDIYAPLPQTPEEAILWEKFVPAWEAWSVENNDFMEHSDQLLATDILNPTKLRQDLEIFRGDHYKLESSIANTMLGGKSFEGGDDAATCNLGKWMATQDIDNPKVKAELVALKTPHDEFHAAVKRIKSLVKTGQVDAAKTLFRNKMLPAAEQVFGHLRVLRNISAEVEELFHTMEEQSMITAREKQNIALNFLREIVQINEIVSEEEVINAESAASNASMTAIVGMVAGAIIALLLGIVLARSITSPILKGVSFAEKLSKGNLNATVDVHQKDEIGILAAALRLMTDKLREVVGSVKSATDNVASGSEELSATAQTMAQGATEQASSIEEISASIEQVAANIQQNTENARTTESLASKSAKDAEEGGKAVTQTVKSMKEIADKVSVIEDIVRQTNLLALNAAIEAARAGEHGKGFAVVASEVRKLAQKSGEAAVEINKLSTSSVEVAEKAGEMINGVIPDIQKTADLVQEIAAASIEQNTGVEQINSAVQQLDQVVQQNAAASEEMASTSEELSSQAQMLMQTMTFFSLDESGTMTQAVVQHKPMKLEAAPTAKKEAANGDDDGVALDMGGGEDYDEFEKF